MDYGAIQAVNAKSMERIRIALLIYDIMCQWALHFLKRVQNSKDLHLEEDLLLLKAIGDFHVHGHVESCTPRYGLSFIPGAGIIDGEILETLWSVLNNISRSTQGATLAHWGEILDDHMNHSNWKKMLEIGELHNQDACSGYLIFHSSNPPEKVDQITGVVPIIC